MNKKITINSWNDVSLSMYDSIVDVVSDDSKSELDKDISVLSIIMGVDESELYDMKIGDLSELREKIYWLYKFDFPKKLKTKKYVIGDYECVLDTDLSKFTVSQYVDFQTFSKDESNNKARILSCFLIPKGRKYNDGYDVNDLVNEINSKVDIVTYNAICFFFLKQSVTSIKRSALSLGLMMRMKSMKMSRKNPLKEPMKEASEKVFQLRRLMFGSL